MAGVGGDGDGNIGGSGGGGGVGFVITKLCIQPSVNNKNIMLTMRTCYRV